MSVMIILFIPHHDHIALKRQCNLILPHICMFNIAGACDHNIFNNLVPEFIEAQSDIYALLDSNITLNCTPSDDRTPVYWTIYANR